MLRKLMSAFGCALFVFLIAAAPAQARDRFLDSHKDGDYDKGIIEDYSDMVEGNGVEWVYLAPGVKLNDYTIKVGQIGNKSSITNRAMLDSAEDTFEAALRRKGNDGRKGTLNAEAAVYWAERPSAGKRWIPYAGMHLAQAGVGIEMILRDSKGAIVAKVRHSGRQGDKLEYAAEEVADDIVSWISEN